MFRTRSLLNRKLSDSRFPTKDQEHRGSQSVTSMGKPMIKCVEDKYATDVEGSGITVEIVDKIC